MSSLKKVVNRRTYKERAQPAARQKLGFLEKHKDYVLRARDYHRKEKRLKSLKEKASFKNPDEFYFGMVNARTNGGVHMGQRKTPRYDVDTLKAYKVQDHGYIRYHETVNRAKIQRLENEAQLAILEDDEEPEAFISGPSVPKRTVFVDSLDDVKAAVPLATKPTKLSRKLEVDIDEEEEEEVQPRKKSREARELAARKEREEKLMKLEMEVNLQKALMSKGARKKVGEHPNGVPKYKWANERKK